MKTLRHIASTALLVVACLACMGCDNGNTSTVPSGEADRAKSEPAPALEVPDKSSENEPGKVVVWVNGEPLEKSRVDRQLRELTSLYGTQRRPLEGQELQVKRRLITERLIDRKLLDQWLDEHDRPAVTAQEVDRAIADEIENRFGDEEVLQRHLERRGATLSDYRADLQRQLQLERMLATSDVAHDPPDAGVAKTFESIMARPAHDVRVRAASFFVPWPANVPRQQVEDEVVRVATAAKGANEFEAAASKINAKWNADYDPDIGWTRKGETAGDVGRTLFNTQTGHATEVIRTPLGLQVFFVLEREKLDSAHFKRHRATLEKHLRKQDILRRKRALVEQLRSNAVLRWSEGTETAGER